MFTVGLIDLIVLDPYVEVKLGSSSGKTKTRYKTLEPDWGTVMTFDWWAAPSITVSVFIAPSQICLLRCRARMFLATGTTEIATRG